MENTRTPYRPAVVALLAAAIVCAPVSGEAQESTERYIPIGQSPGLSYQHSYIGRIDSVNPDERQMTVKSGEDMHVVRINDRTRIWLDRSEMKQTNLTGGPSDCRPGRLVEVKFADPETKRVADWIKVKITKADGYPDITPRTRRRE